MINNNEVVETLSHNFPSWFWRHWSQRGEHIVTKETEEIWSRIKWIASGQTQQEHQDYYYHCYFSFYDFTVAENYHRATIFRLTSPLQTLVWKYRPEFYNSTDSRATRLILQLHISHTHKTHGCAHRRMCVSVFQRESILLSALLRLFNIGCVCQCVCAA